MGWEEAERKKVLRAVAPWQGGGGSPKHLPIMHLPLATWKLGSFGEGPAQERLIWGFTSRGWGVREEGFSPSPERCPASFQTWDPKEVIWELHRLPQGCDQVLPDGSQRRRMSVNALLALEATSLSLPSILFPLFSPTSFSDPWQDLYSLHHRPCRGTSSAP